VGDSEVKMLSRIEEEEPSSSFPWEKDKLGREKLAQQLLPILKTIKQPMTLGLYGPYGSGKTNFVKRLKAMLEAKSPKISCVYLNAWETDMSDNPFWAILSSLRKTLIELAPRDRQEALADKASKLVNVAIKVTIHDLLPSLLEGLIKKSTPIDDPKKLLAKIRSTIDEIDLSKLRSEQERQNSLKKFKADLEEILKMSAPPGPRMSPPPEGRTTIPSETRRDPVFVFVDELDRCRPTYALELLECLKHLFMVEGLVFVISIDKRMLRSAIRVVYGDGIDDEGYIRRFINWGIHLPVMSSRDFALETFKKLGISELPGIDRTDLDIAASSFSYFSNLTKLPLRDQEQLIAEINLALHLHPKSRMPSLSDYCTIAIIRKRFPQKFFGVLSREISYKAIVKEISELASEASSRESGTEETKWEDKEAELYSMFMVEKDANGTLSDSERTAIRYVKTRNERYNFPSSEIYASIVDKMLDVASSIDIAY
jgi:hypothetical protein